VPSPVQAISIVVSLSLLGAVLALVRRKRLTEEYSFLWVVFAAALLALSIFRGALHAIARWLGIYYPPAVLLLMLILFVFVASLYFSVVISRQRQQIERLVEDQAILERDVEMLRQISRGSADSPPGPPPSPSATPSGS
jgi:hypothetical protein